MKKIIAFLILICFGYAARAQHWVKVYSYNEYLGLTADSVLIPPQDTTFSNPTVGSLAIFNGHVYQRLSTAWSQVDGGGNAVQSLTGSQSIQYGAFNSMPSPGTPGRFYAATDSSRWYFDNGTAWLNLSGSGGGGGGGGSLLTFGIGIKPGSYNGSSAVTINADTIAMTTRNSLDSGLATKQTTALSPGDVWIGNGSGVAQQFSVTGDFAFSSSGVGTINANAVTLAKQAQAPANTIPGNNTVSTANLSYLSPSQIVTMLNAVSNFLGVQQVGYGLYASHPTGSQTVLYFASDSTQTGGLFYWDGSAMHNLTPQVTLSVRGLGQPGDTTMITLSGNVLLGFKINVAALRDSAGGCVHHVFNLDGSLTIYSTCTVLNGTGYVKMSGSTPAYQTNTQLTADVNTFTTSLSGAVPSPGSVAGKVLSDNGTWVTNGEDTTNISNRIKAKVDTSGELGVIYNANSWTSADIGTTFTDSTGGDVSVVGGKLVFGTATGGDYKHTLNLATPTTLFHWDMWVKVKVAVTSGGTSIGAGTRSTNTAGGYHEVEGSFQTNTGASNGNVNLTNIDVNTATSLGAGVNAFSATNGGYVLLHVKRDMYTVSVSVRDYTNNTAEFTTAYTYTDQGASAFMPNTGTFSIYYFGGSFTIDSISISSSETKHANLLNFLDSKGAGYEASTFQNSFAYLLGTKYGPVVNYSGGSDASADWLLALQTVHSLAPRQVLLTPPSNDPRTGVSNAVSDSNFAKIYDSLVSWGIRVIVNQPFFETSEDLTFQKTFVLSGRVGTNIIDTWTPMTWNGSLYTDGIHPSDLGHARIFSAIVGANLISQFSNVNQYYGSNGGLTNSASANTIPLSASSTSLVNSYAAQAGTAGASSAILNVAAQLHSTGPGSALTLQRRDNSTDVWSIYSASGALNFQDDVNSVSPFIVPEASTTPNPYQVGGFFQTRGSGNAYPLIVNTDATGRGFLILPKGQGYATLTTFGMQGLLNTTYGSFQAFTNVSTGTTLPFALNPAGGKVWINQSSNTTAAQLQIVSPGNPQLSLIYNSSDTTDFTVNSSGNLTIAPSGGKVAIKGYGSGTNTGTATFAVNVDASGNLIEGTLPTAGIGGQYIPTITNNSNATSITSDSANYSRSGNTVTVFGNCQITPTSGTVNTQVSISLPIASLLNGGHACWGQSMTSQTTNGGVGGIINSGLANHQANLTIYATGGTTSFTVTYSFSYQVQ